VRWLREHIRLGTDGLRGRRLWSDGRISEESCDVVYTTAMYDGYTVSSNLPWNRIVSTLWRREINKSREIEELKSVEQKCYAIMMWR